MSAELAVQVALRQRLALDAGVTALVPAGNILDVNQRPAPSPSIILGESQAVDEGDSIARNRQRIYHTVHVWQKEPSLQGVKRICGEIRRAIHADRLLLAAGFHAADARVADMRQMRDPDGLTSHGVVTVEVLVQEVA
ncbi:hypothetical protein RSWS8N_06275 [Cereibacter sphaeroides WS8N]|jgi:hypothetical protein|uniref:DUF3168 domain-containing protein n=1 Tax=Cereibacter sphaeroides TaxID=1063 RepID=UPI0000664133|nr:DUF3168 domain-containing protein [Cereibacter sphaeroides]ABN75402.1 hypothetical protein Rsph17029_0284 [Cereibacter sphaeroides ATCC 17029]EGJ21667.1 hypothetical protein RSWS8N_06275 [Cereibacter sphaeroides WS8N]